jgi:hypothetical protein
MSERTCHNCGSRHDCSAYKHGFVGEDATCWRAEGQGRCPLTLVVKPDGSGTLAACRVAELEQQLTAERTRAEQAEAALSSARAEYLREENSHNYTLDKLNDENRQLKQERERAEADYGALKLVAGDMSRVLQAGYVNPEAYQQALAELERILSQPHPGDSFRSALRDVVEALEGIKGFATRKQGHYTADFLDELLREIVDMLTMALAKAGEVLTTSTP